MKTDNISSRPPVNYGGKERADVEVKQKEMKAAKEALPNKIGRPATDRIELKESAINNPEAVKKLIGDNIQWREMKFYQRQEDGMVYIDVVDKSSGNVVRTIPDTKFAEVSSKIKEMAGIKSINISG